MLSVRKTALITGLKVGGLEVRKAELDFYILRYIMTSGVATVWTGECHLRQSHTHLPQWLRASNTHRATLWPSSSLIHGSPQNQD
jgi:hypothetical protein